MNDKIVVVSMVKNEADIIESFVRYYMTFADGMIIVDHNSDDDTGNILNELQKEYPSLIIEKSYTVEHIQNEIMTNLVKFAAIELQADWILPMDADEFLIPSNMGIDIRSLLSRMNYSVVSLNWIDYEFVDHKSDRDIFILNRPCNKSLTVNAMPKIIIKGTLVRNNNIRLTQGNHGVRLLKGAGVEEWVPFYKNLDLILAHFPFRSQEQYISKNVIGWLTNTLKYSSNTLRATHWKKAFDAICNGDDRIPTIPKSKYVGKPHEESIKLKYTNSDPINVFSRVLKLSECVFDMYARQNIVNQVQPVTIVMPLNNEFEAAVATIDSLLKQTLQKWKLFIIMPDDLDLDVKNAFRECDNRINIIGLNDIIQPEGFVKLLKPGIKLKSDCLELEAVALYNHAECNLTYSNAENCSGLILGVEEPCLWMGREIWDAIKDKTYSLTGGVSGMMLRKLDEHMKLSSVIDNYMWKEKDILEILLPESSLFVFPNKYIEGNGFI